MNDALGVRVLQRLEDLHQRLDLRFEIQIAAIERGREVLPLEKLHRDVHEPRRLGRLEHGDDVRVLEARDGLRFAIQPLEINGVFDVGPDGLDGDDSAQRRIEPFVDVAHAAAAETSLDFETPNRLRDRQEQRHLRHPM